MFYDGIANRIREASITATQKWSQAYQAWGKPQQRSKKSKGGFPLLRID